MKRAVVTLLALGLTAGLICLFPRAVSRETEAAPRKEPILRVWVTDREPAVAAWLKKQAAAYEKTAGVRVYLRKAAGEEAENALQGEDGAPAPDVLIGPEGDTPVALQGYALILRDDGAAMITPAPTALLFSRPSPVPGPTAAPPAQPDWREIGAVLAPSGLSFPVPGAVASADPARDFAAGKARAALLTAGQAERLAVGFQAYPVAAGGGLLPIGGRAFTQEGISCLSHLQSGAAQGALADHGLYAVHLLLYTSRDPVRQMIDSSRAE